MACYWRLKLLPQATRNIRSRAAIFAVLLLALFLAATSGPAQAQAPDKVSLGLVWVHQAQFAGYYMAKDHGIYRKYNLEVELRPGGPGIEHLKSLQKGTLDFCSLWLSTAMEARSYNSQLVNLAQILQRSALLLVAMADNGVETIKDLDGRRVGLWGAQFSLAPLALFLRERIQPRVVNQNVSISPFLRGAVDAAAAMRYNELHQIYQAGVDLDSIKVFDLAKLGINFPEDGLYTLESTWRDKQDICRRFVRASLEGWRLAISRPDQALNSVMRRVTAARLATNRPHQAWMLKIINQNVMYGVTKDTMGRLSPKDYDLVGKVLMERKIISKTPALKDFSVPAWESGK